MSQKTIEIHVKNILIVPRTNVNKWIAHKVHT